VYECKTNSHFVSSILGSPGLGMFGLRQILKKSQVMFAKCMVAAQKIIKNGLYPKIAKG
jgi:hypothetical protein